MIMFTRCMTNCTGNRILIFPLRKPFWSIWRFCGQKLISRLLIGTSWELFHMIPIGTVLQQNRRRQFNNFYVLPLPVLRTRAGVSSDMPPAPRRAAPDRNISEVIHLPFTHATNQGNFVAIMREGRLAASKLHHSDSESFFAQGFKLGQTTWDDQELGRILHNGTTLSKNECGVVFLGLAWGTGEVVHQGGEGQCISMTKPGKHGCVHHKRGRMWVISTQSHVLQGLAWNSQEKAPSSIFSWFSWFVLFFEFSWWLRSPFSIMLLWAISITAKYRWCETPYYIFAVPPIQQLNADLTMTLIKSFEATILLLRRVVSFSVAYLFVY